jgi:hypothetical protein
MLDIFYIVGLFCYVFVISLGRIWFFTYLEYPDYAEEVLVFGIIIISSIFWPAVVALCVPVGLAFLIVKLFKKEKS